MFKSFKALRTVRTLFDQDGNLYRVAKRVLEKVGSRFRSGYKRFAKNSLFYTEALPNVIGVTTSYTKGAGFESINQSQVTGLRSFSAYDIIGASSIDDQYLTFKPNVSSSDYPKPTFDPDDSVGAGIFTKSLWNHNQLSYTKDMFSDDAYNLYWTKGDNWRESWATWTNLGEVAPNGSNAYEVIVSGNSVDNFVAFRGGGYNLDNIGVFDDTKVSMFSMYIKAPEDTSKAVGRFRVIMTDRSSPVQYPSIYWSWDSENSRWEEEPLGGQAVSTRIAHTEDLGNGWQRITAGVIGSDYTTATNSGDELEIDLRFDNLSLSANKGFIFAEPQFEQHPINKPSWSHNSVWQSLDQWTEGIGGMASDWNDYGNAADSIREYRTDPFGKQSILWVSQDNDTTKNGEGGFESLPNISIDSSASYRYSVWMRKPSDFIGNATIYFGSTPNYAYNPLYAVKWPTDQLPEPNPYFITGSQSTLLPNPGEWYLAVGFIDAAGTNRGGYHPDTGFYDFEGNQRQVGTIRSWEFSSTATHQSIRAFQNANPAGQGDEIEFWAPRIDKLDGNEPSISDLLNPIDNPNYPPVTKATPYVGNDAIPANVHRHNWLNYTNDLATSSNWNFTRVDLQPSTIGTSVYSGETAYEVVPDDPIGNWPIIYTSGDGISFNADETKVASVYIKSHDKNPTFMPPINSTYSGLEEWTVGTGAMTDWALPPQTNASSNERIYAEDPFGGQSIVWKAFDDGASDTSPWEGGFYWDSSLTGLDFSKDHRFSVFVKQHDNQDGVFYFGAQQWNLNNALFNQSTGAFDPDPYFKGYTDNKEVDKWYLWVGYINASGTASGSLNYGTEAGVYDLSGNKVDGGFKEYTFSSTNCTEQHLRVFYFADAVNDGAIGASFFHPRIDALDGNEPSIERLLDSVKAKQPAVNFPAFAEIPWLDEGLDNFSVVNGWTAVDQANATTTTSSLKTPFNTEEVVVVANNEPFPDGPYEGGIQLQQQTLPIDNTKKYRYSIFAKKATDEGGMYIGPYHYGQANAELLRLNNGALDTNPYFHQNKDFGTSEWVLMVGHIWPYTTASGTANDPDSGVWTMDGNKIAAYSNDFDFMTRSTTTEQGFRAFFWGDVTDDLNKAYFWQPRIDIVDGTEPSIEELLRLQPGLTINLLDFSAPTKIHRAAFGVDASGVVYPKYIVGGELDGFGVEEVGDGWYRAWAYKEGLDSVSNTVEGDDLYYYLYFGDAAQPFADVSATINNDFRSTLIMKPMVERLGIDQAVSDPPTAYQEVPDNTWPSVSAIPYHQVAKEVELSIKDDTTGSSYTAKAYWDGGKLYNYGPRITNQDVEITQLQDGWHKFGTGIRGLGDGTINAGDTASMTFSYAASSNPRSKTLISGPILANTGSEKSSKVNYSPGTQTPGVNFIPNTADWDDYFGGSFLTPANPAVITMDKINTPGPYDPSSFIFSSDEGVQQSRDYVLFYPYSGRDEVKFSESDTVVTHIHAKSLWNYNELPYTRNILDDPNFTDGSDQYGSFYSHQGQYTVVDGETGPDGYSKVLSFSSPYSGFLTRSVLQYPYFNWNWYNHRWDENMISTFSVFVKAPDNPEETPTQFRFNFIDNLNPQDTEYQFFSWGPNQAPKESISNTIPKGFVEDVGDGWYRLSVSVSGLLDEDGIKTKNGDTQVIKWEISQFEVGQNFKMCQPQMEHHRINDTNLLKPSWDWYAIQGPTTINNVNGWVGYGSGENGIEIREDPFGLSSLCWVGYDLSAPDPQDGGLIDSPAVPIDPNSTYRYSVFVKLAPETEGQNKRSVYFGPDSHGVADTDQYVRYYTNGDVHTNPYFCIALDEGQIGNDWVLLVAHVQPSGTTIPASLHPDTGIYAMDGTEISVTASQSISDYLWDATTTNQELRVFAWGNTDNDGTESIRIWSPRIEKVDGTEPSISELLASGNLWTNPNYQQTLPSPYVENVGVHPNPHRHNWLAHTEDIDPVNNIYWTLQQGTLTASTIDTAYANGDTCFLYTMPNSGTSNFILYAGGPPGVLEKSWDEDNQYVASIYIKQLDSSFSGFNLAFGDVSGTGEENRYAAAFNIDGSTLTFGFIGNEVNAYGSEYIADGWHRVWWSVDSSNNSNTVDGDGMRLYFYFYQHGVSDLNAMYGKTGVAIMKPMVEILDINQALTDPPRSYQAVQGEWNLGVTSIPEHQCSTEVELWPADWTTPGQALKTSFDREGGVWKTDYTQSAVNMSSEHVGDGWYKLTTSVSGTTANPSTVEGDNVRVMFYPTQFDPDKDITAFSLISAPFIGMTGSVDVSSVPHTRGVLE